MTIKELNIEVENKEKELQTALEGYHALKQSKVEEFKDLFTKCLADILEKDDEIKVDEGSIKILRQHPDYSYKRDVITIYMDGERLWNDGDYNTMRGSFYTTTENSEFELRRMVLIGKVGEFILNHSKGVLTVLNQIKDEYKEGLGIQLKNRFKLEEEIKNLKSEIQYLEKTKLLEKLEGKGIELEFDCEGRSYPTLQLKFDYEIGRVNSLKIIGKTPSGKSADVEGTYLYRQYNEEGGLEWVERVFKEEKVRMSNLHDFVTCYSKYIK